MNIGGMGLETFVAEHVDRRFGVTVVESGANGEDGLQSSADMGHSTAIRLDSIDYASGSRRSSTPGGGDSSNSGIQDEPHAAPGEPHVDAETLADAAYYMKYAFAAYGWMLFVWQKRTFGVIQLCCGRACGLWALPATLRRRGNIVDTVRAPRPNTEAILLAAELKEKDLVFVRQEGLPDVLPYFIAVDHIKQTVVLAIRGSLSLEDCVRDLLFEPADLDEWVMGGETWGAPLPEVQRASDTTVYAAHSGILEAARATLIDIQASGHLKQVLGTGGAAQGYSLVVCGHSLGAGCAFLVSLYLKKFYAGTRCLCFSPPGGLATTELCASAGDWCTSIVCGKEIVPRLTLATFEHVRDELVACAIHCKRPKLSLFWGWLRGKVWLDADIFYDSPLPEEPRRWLEEYRASLASSAAKRSYIEVAAKFGPPGRVMHLKPTGRRRQGKGDTLLLKKVTREYKCVWVDGQELVERGIVLSGRMMSDHMPDYSLTVLQRLAAAAATASSTARVSDDAGEQTVKERVGAWMDKFISRG